MLPYYLLKIVPDTLVLEQLFWCKFRIEVPLYDFDGFSSGRSPFSDTCLSRLVGLGTRAVTACTVAGFVRRRWPLMVIKTDQACVGAFCGPSVLLQLLLLLVLILIILLF